MSASVSLQAIVLDVLSVYMVNRTKKRTPSLRRCMIVNTYTDIATTAKQKLDLKYIHRYNYYGNAET
jgi:hypothetical protein